MRCRDRRAQKRCKIDPQRCGQQCAQHEIAKVDNRDGIAGRNDALGYGFDHVTAGQQCACAFTDRRDHDGARDRKYFATDRRTHVVGYIIGTDIQCHVATNDRGADHQEDAFAG